MGKKTIRKKIGNKLINYLIRFSFKNERATSLELATSGLGSRRSTN
jgi:hypothetical protein